MDKFCLKNGENVTIRQITLDDYDAYCVFFEKLAKETIFTNQYVGRPRRTKEVFEAQVRDTENLYRLVVCRDDGEIVGTCTVFVMRPEHPWLNRTCDFGIMLLDAYTGQRLGTFLMKKMEDWARLKNMHRIEAQVRTKNVKAMALYLKCGFEIEGVAHDAAYINGTWHHQYYIAKLL